MYNVALGTFEFLNLGYLWGRHTNLCVPNLLWSDLLLFSTIAKHIVDRYYYY
jgi:hypothetical protein